MAGDADIPRYEIAEQALAKLETFLDDWEGSDWSHTRPAQEIRSIVDVAVAQLHMACQRRDRRPARWLARVTSFVFGRGFNEPGQFGNDPDPHLCFLVEITDGSKLARGKTVEVQVPDDEMERLAKQILRMTKLRRTMKARKA